MNAGYKKVLYIDLGTHEYKYKVHEDLWPYIGGIGVAYKIMLDNHTLDPLIIGCGPLSGYFPYVSKCVLMYKSDGGIVEKYGGGTIAAKLNMAEIDAVVLYGQPPDDLSITIFQKEITFSTGKGESIEAKVEDFSISPDLVISQKYFSFGEITEKLRLSARVDLSIDISVSRDLSDYYGYEQLYSTALDEYKKLSVEPANNPSCFGCPIGCDKSAEGEDDKNVAVLPRCLVACGYAEEIYKTIPFVYACLSSVGYNYRHEQLEEIPNLVGELKKEINEILNRELETE